MVLRVLAEKQKIGRIARDLRGRGRWRESGCAVASRRRRPVWWTGFPSACFAGANLPTVYGATDGAGRSAATPGGSPLRRGFAMRQLPVHGDVAARRPLLC